MSENFDAQENLQLDILDPESGNVSYKMGKKISDYQYLLRISFIPMIHGIHKLFIRYNTEHIPDSPFEFKVEENRSTKIKSEPLSLITMREQSPVQPHLNVPPVQSIESNSRTRFPSVSQKLQERLSITPFNTPNVHPSQTASMSVGRGRLFSISENVKKNKALANGTCAITQREPYVPQKRKSPRSSLTNNINNIDDVEMETDTGVEMSDLSRKFKKMVYVNETENQYHNYSQSSISSINVITDEQEIMPNSTYEKIKSQNILSDHLRKHSASNGLIRPLIDNNKRPLIDFNIVPPVKALFERKFTDCSFPIGVRCDKSRNWLIVCDSSTNSIKIFNNLDGSLIHQIDENADKYRGKIKLKRPSAVLINNDDNNSEIYVKDDKEIFVFDLKNNFEFKRKFGFQILKRPYGLAYDSKMNLVLIDADLRNPLIYIFNKYTGQVISSKPYHPIIPTYAQGHSLIRRFGESDKEGKKPILGSNIRNFDGTKVRFIYCNHDYLYASDLGRSIVYKTNLNGEIELAFGHFGKRIGEFVEPSGIHVESDGNAILIGDSKNDRLQVNKFI